jgi:TP901 family phage tail tape measure protein
MTDFAELVATIDSSGVKRGEDDLKRFTRTAEDTERKTKGATDRMASNFDRSESRIAATLGRLTGRLVALGAAAISVGQAGRTLAQFESAMSKVAAITGSTGAELEKLRATAQRLGGSTEFSATQAADALTYLGMAGYSASESMAALPSVLDLATASGMGLAQSADIASNVLSGFGMEAKNSASVADVLAAASTSANTSVSQLGQAMSTAAPIAASLGIGLEETAASIGVMSDAGIQGERAGTALRGVLASLANPTKQARDALAGYGLTAAEVDPATEGLANVMARLREAGISTADAMTIFGREAASGALVLVEGADRFRTFTSELREADGAAGDMAATMRDNLGGDINGALSAVQGLILALGDAGLTAALRASVQGATALVRAMTGVVSAVSDGTKIVGSLGEALAILAATQIPAVVAATGRMVAQLYASSVATRALTSAVMGLNTAVSLIGGPIGILFGVIAGAAVGIRNSAQAAREFTSALDGMAEAQGRLDTATTQFYKNMTSANLEAMKAAAQRSRDAVAEALKAAEAELEAAKFYTNAFGVSLFETERMAAARSAIKELKGDLAEAEARLSAADHAAANFARQLEDGKRNADDLSRVAGQIDFSGATASAAALARQLGVSLDIANKIDRAMDRQAGINRPGPTRLGGDAFNAPNVGLGQGLGTMMGETLTMPENTVSQYEAITAGLNNVTTAARGASSSQKELSEVARQTQQILGEVAKEAVTYADVVNHLSELLKSGKISQEQFNAAVEEADEKYNKADKSGKKVGDQLGSMFSSAIRNAESLSEALTEIIQKLAEMALNAALMDLFGGIFGGSSSGKGGLFGGAVVPGILHQGGTAGKDGYNHARSFPASMFIGAPRYHNGGTAGLRPNEVPAILEKGERVIPNGAQVSGDGPPIEFRVINNASGTEVEQRRERGPDGRELLVAEINTAVSRGEMDGSFGSRYGAKQRKVSR